MKNDASRLVLGDSIIYVQHTGFLLMACSSWAARGNHDRNWAFNLERVAPFA